MRRACKIPIHASNVMPSPVSCDSQLLLGLLRITRNPLPCPGLSGCLIFFPSQEFCKKFFFNQKCARYFFLDLHNPLSKIKWSTPKVSTFTRLTTPPNLLVLVAGAGRRTFPFLWRDIFCSQESGHLITGDPSHTRTSYICGHRFKGFWHRQNPCYSCCNSGFQSP